MNKDPPNNIHIMYIDLSNIFYEYFKDNLIDNIIKDDFFGFDHKKIMLYKKEIFICLWFGGI